MKNFLKEKNKGVTLYMAILMVGSVAVIATSISSLMIGEFKISGDVIKSMNAVNSAGSGLESALYQLRVVRSLGDGVYTCSADLDLPSLNCSVNVNTAFSDGEPCNGLYDCTKVQSTGTSGGFNRKIQAVYQNR